MYDGTKIVPYQTENVPNGTQNTTEYKSIWSCYKNLFLKEPDDVDVGLDFLSVDTCNAQWSVGVTKHIHEICNIHTNMNFMEAFGYILIKNDLKTLFKTAFRCFDKL